MHSLGIDAAFRGRNLARLLEGLWVSLRISLTAVLLSIPLGILLGLLMTKKNAVVRLLTRLYLETVRILPQMVLLFIVFFGSTRVFGWNVEAEKAAVIVFTFWGTAELADLVRGAVESIPKHQREIAEALGFSGAGTALFILLPQTVRRLLPLSVGLVTRMIKTTSLVTMIGVVEVLKVGQQIIEANRKASPNAAFGIYAIIFFLYFAVCFPISLLSKHLERKWSFNE